MASASNGTNNITYTYDANGLRHTKTVDGVVYTYYYAGDKLVRETFGSTIIDFFYDPDGRPYAMKYNSMILYYVLNQQGDVVRLIDSEGVNYGTYKYDAWGNILQMPSTNYIKNNPLRYRGYIYDPETELYYCQSRYYDPKIGRFLTSDVAVSTGQGLTGNNMYAYCGNNPVSRVDSSGTAWETVWDLISLGYSIAEVAMNPRDLGAWLGLAGDFVDVAIPFVGGIGETARAMNAIGDAVDAVDDLCDAADTIDDTVDAAKALHRPYIRTSTREAVEEAARRAPDGRFLDANTGLPIDGKYDLGHVYGHEFWRERDRAMLLGWTQKQFNDYMNNPKFYQIEDPFSNRSHIFEMR